MSYHHCLIKHCKPQCILASWVHIKASFLWGPCNHFYITSILRLSGPSSAHQRQRRSRSKALKCQHQAIFNPSKCCSQMYWRYEFGHHSTCRWLGNYWCYSRHGSEYRTLHISVRTVLASWWFGSYLHWTDFAFHYGQWDLIKYRSTLSINLLSEVRWWKEQC